MASATTRNLLVAAILTGGLLAGMNCDRAFVAMPAWQEIGPQAWAEFSRHADLGNGRLLYPVLAIGNALLILGASLSVRFDHSAPRAAALPIYLAAILALAGLALTLKAAPVMLGIEDASGVETLRRAFEDFRFWGNLRGACQVLAFFAVAWAVRAFIRSSD
jgi:hypothetical protein